MDFVTAILHSGLADKARYLDPGSGSLLLQLLIAGLAGIGIAVATGWKKIKRLFGRKTDSLPADAAEDEEDD